MSQRASVGAAEASSQHRRFGDHFLCEVRWAALALADEAQQRVLAWLVEVELRDLLRPAVNPAGIGRVLEVERWLCAALASPEGLAHRAQRTRRRRPLPTRRQCAPAGLALHLERCHAELPALSLVLKWSVVHHVLARP